MKEIIWIKELPMERLRNSNFESDLHFTKKKIKAGADYIVTQMFFDNTKYFEYVDKCRATGIDVPIIPGLKPLTKRYQLNSIPRRFFLNLPEPLVKAVAKAKTSADIKEVGIEWAIEQCKELKAKGVPCLHFYTMGDWETTKRIIEAVM
jgi:methylenetetrahydrofolate reductase (NADPH)